MIINSLTRHERKNCKCLAEGAGHPPLGGQHPCQDAELVHRRDQDQPGGGQGQRQVPRHHQELDQHAGQLITS